MVIAQLAGLLSVGLLTVLLLLAPNPNPNLSVGLLTVLLPLALERRLVRILVRGEAALGSGLGVLMRGEATAWCNGTRVVVVVLVVVV